MQPMNTLSPGFGVGGAIHTAAGPGLADECGNFGGCPTGEARINGGHNLKAKHVIHTVGPKWSKRMDSFYRAILVILLVTPISATAEPFIHGLSREAQLRGGGRSHVPSLHRHRESRCRNRSDRFATQSSLEAKRESLPGSILFPSTPVRMGVTGRRPSR